MKVSNATIIRTIVLVVALINQILTSTGHSVLPISDDQITEIVTLLFTVGSAFWAWWKNNSFTPEALKADRFLNSLRASKEGE